MNVGWCDSCTWDGNGTVETKKMEICKRCLIKVGENAVLTKSFWCINHTQSMKWKMKECDTWTGSKTWLLGVCLCLQIYPLTWNSWFCIFVCLCSYSAGLSKSLWICNRCRHACTEPKKPSKNKTTKKRRKNLLAWWRSWAPLVTVQRCSM